MEKEQKHTHGSGRRVAEGQARRPAHFLQPLLLVLAALAVIFGLYEIVERTWLGGVDPRVIHMLHIFRGVGASLLAAFLVGWSIFKTSRPLLEAAPSESAGVERVFANDREKIEHYARWFVQMRWIAVVVALALIFITVKLAHLLPPEVWWPLLLTVAALAGFNVFFLLLLRRDRGTHFLLPLQVYGDLVILTVLLQFSGGIENPLFLLTIFHVVIAGILLPRWQCYLVAAAASTLVGLLAWAEFTHVTAHYTLLIFPHVAHSRESLVHAAHYAPYVTCCVVLLAALLFLTAYFVTTLAERARADERQARETARHALAAQRLLEQSLARQKQAQAQLMQAGKMAAVGELAGNVAHEVNNPIAIISAKGRLLLSDHRREMSAKVAGEIAKITEAADRVARIARGLLSYCRPSGAMRTPQDIRIPVRKALAMVEHRAGKENVRIEDRLPEGLPLVKANANEIEQIFLNLFLNALDAMPRGGRLALSACGGPERLPGGAPAVAVQVEDTGTGIPETIRERIFEPFFTTKEESKGTGLGLCICLGLVRSHEGEIGVDSAPGKGTRFSVHFPSIPPDVPGETRNG